MATRKRAQDAAEAQADAILARDAQLLQDLGQHVEALQHCYQALLRPRNDPQYVATLEDHEKDRTQVANVTATIHHTVSAASISTSNSSSGIPPPAWR